MSTIRRQIWTSLSIGLTASVLLGTLVLEPAHAWGGKKEVTGLETAVPATSTQIAKSTSKSQSPLAPFMGDNWHASPLIDTTAPQGATPAKPGAPQTPAGPPKPDPEVVLKPILPFVSDIEKRLQIPQQSPALKTPERLNRLQEIVFGSRVYTDAGEVLAKLASLFPQEAAKSRPALAALLPKNPSFAPNVGTATVPKSPNMAGTRPLPQQPAYANAPTSNLQNTSQAPLGMTSNGKGYYRPNPMPPAFQTQDPQPGIEEHIQSQPNSNDPFGYQQNMAPAPQPHSQPTWGSTNLSFPKPAYAPANPNATASPQAEPTPFYNEPPSRNVQLNHAPVTAPSPSLQRLANKFFNNPQKDDDAKEIDWDAWDRYMDGPGTAMQ